jgi:DNA-binding response OmpR family regulator
MQVKKRILLIDDETDFRAALRVRLEAAGYEVLEAEDGATGLDMAKEQKPDLIILDLMLPKIAGYNVARLLKADENCDDIPIVMLTARAQETDVNIGLAVGADAYITKPFKSRELLDTITRLIE